MADRSEQWWVARTRVSGYWRNLGLYALCLAAIGALVVAVWMARAYTMTFVHPVRAPLQQTPEC